MITLKRDGKVMEVATELQASAFIKNGYEKVEKAVPKAETPAEEAEAKPKRRRRAAAVSEPD